MQEIPKQFNFREDEEKIYALWEQSGFFNPDNVKSNEKYCNVLPPPNANGELHLGHASGYTVMDIFGRYERMKGKKVLLLPGKDHAGILTQVVYEQKLKKEKGITRQKLGRKQFFKEVYEFCSKMAAYMREQEKRIGISADWSREKFTLDPKISDIALATFVKMYKDGLIYKGKRIISWCPRCGSALSDLEVDYQEREGKLYYIKYQIENSKDYVVVATTRPETMLGDTAVAVNPKDKKHANIVGKNAILPLLDRPIPVIADKRVDMDFGTGAVKITPAHDPLDWEIGKDHKLPEIQVIDEKSEITPLGEKYEGMGVREAREKIIEDLKKAGLLLKIEIIKHSVSECERCKSTIEPLISDQWFINVEPLKKMALKAIKKGEIKIYPESFEKILISWFENLRDWCISRQIWWGHQFPVWYKDGKTHIGIKPPEGGGWKQDENTFDTWFSSGQWAYTTLDFPNGKDYKNFYPTDMMVMGRDILFFWGARMIMMGLYCTGKIPFKNLYFTGLVRDKDGHKMSKSRGNGIDPLEMIKKYGADALRLSLSTDTTPGLDVRLYEEKIEGFRNFVTKLWNIFRYCSQAENFKLVEELNKEDIKTLADKWIVSELEEAKMTINSFMEHKEMSLAQMRLRRLTWDQFADWYIEIHKIEKNTKVLGYVLENIIKMWHPFAPFVTEKIWQILKSDDALLMIKKWPAAHKDFIDKKAQTNFKDLADLIVKIRNIRSNYHISPSEIIEAYGKKIENPEIIEKLSRIKIVTKKPENKLLKVASGEIALELNVADLIDVKQELDSICKAIKNCESNITKTEALSKNKNFLNKANADIINATNARLDEYKQKLEIQKELEENLKSLL